MAHTTFSRETENALRNYAYGYCDALAMMADNDSKLELELRATFTAAAIHYSKTKNDITNELCSNYCFSVLFDYWTDIIESVSNSLGNYDDLYMENEDLFCVCIVPEAMDIIYEAFDVVRDAMERVLSRATNKSITKLPNKDFRD